LSGKLAIYIISRMKDEKFIRIQEHKQLMPYALITCVLILAGCAPRPSSIVHLPSAPERRGTRDERRQLMEIAEDVLTRMHFTIDKFDPNSGYIKTRPLPGAQFFELWRSDNIGTKNWINSNLHSIRRTVEISIDQHAKNNPPVNRGAKYLAPQFIVGFNCVVNIQRLSLPARDVIAGMVYVTSSARAYQMFSMSGPALQTLQLHPEQQRRMTWIDLGRDTALENEIVKRIYHRLGGASFVLRPSSIGAGQTRDERRETRDEK
jgi:hypothetical protein